MRDPTPIERRLAALEARMDAVQGIKKPPPPPFDPPTAVRFGMLLDGALDRWRDDLRVLDIKHTGACGAGGAWGTIPAAAGIERAIGVTRDRIYHARKGRLYVEPEDLAEGASLFVAAVSEDAAAANVRASAELIALARQCGALYRAGEPIPIL